MLRLMNERKVLLLRITIVVEVVCRQRKSSSVSYKVVCEIKNKEKFNSRTKRNPISSSFLVAGPSYVTNMGDYIFTNLNIETCMRVIVKCMHSLSKIKMICI